MESTADVLEYVISKLNESNDCTTKHQFDGYKKAVAIVESILVIERAKNGKKQELG